VSVFDSYTREQLRQTYLDAWRKQVDGSPLTPLEAMIADVIGVHPEYQPVIQDPGRALSVDPNAGETEENPFLHMGLHMAVREQIAIDRPPGVRELLGRLRARFGAAHDAEHILMEALAETLWEAQRAGHPPDETRYLDLARRRLSGPVST
jgi:hypothetical protein